MLYVSLGNILTVEVDGMKRGNDPHSFKLIIIKEQIKNENSYQACRGIGKALAVGMEHERTQSTYFPNTTEEEQYDYLPYTQFFNLLGNYSVGFMKLENLANVDKDRQTEIQRLILYSVRALEWDTDLCKQLLGLDKDAQIKDRSYDDLVKLQNNTFLTLAYCAKEYPEKDLKRAIAQILERNFLQNAAYRSFDMWEEETSALIALYSTMEQLGANDRLDHLKKILFDNPDSLFKVYEENTFEYSLQIKGFFGNNLNAQQRKEVETIKAEVQKKASELRQAIAKKVLEIAPEAEFDSYKKYLEKLSYGKLEINKALKELYNKPSEGD